MMRKILVAMAVLGSIMCGANAVAADNNNKNISSVNEVNNMPEDETVYIQGSIIEDLGDENYLFSDGSGTINIEIDEDLIQGNSITPEAIVWIEATVDKKGNITSLEAEEVQFLPSETTPDSSSGK